eukprot:Rhum_TRINITY_DN15443_c3_g3::Rhum_TRINITY_DN15443_c3_g3_i16::g.157294::m.157294
MVCHNNTHTAQLARLNTLLTRRGVFHHHPSLHTHLTPVVWAGYQRVLALVGEVLLSFAHLSHPPTPVLVVCVLRGVRATHPLPADHVLHEKRTAQVRHLQPAPVHRTLLFLLQRPLDARLAEHVSLLALHRRHEDLQTERAHELVVHSIHEVCRLQRIACQLLRHLQRIEVRLCRLEPGRVPVHLPHPLQVRRNRHLPVERLRLQRRRHDQELVHLRREHEVCQRQPVACDVVLRAQQGLVVLQDRLHGLDPLRDTRPAVLHEKQRCDDLAGQLARFRQHRRYRIVHTRSCLGVRRHGRILVHNVPQHHDALRQSEVTLRVRQRIRHALGVVAEARPEAHCPHRVSLLRVRVVPRHRPREERVAADRALVCHVMGANEVQIL